MERDRRRGKVAQEGVDHPGGRLGYWQDAVDAAERSIVDARSYTERLEAENDLAETRRILREVEKEER